MIVPDAPIKINFDVTAVVDSDDGLQPSDLTPENANVRVMILKKNQVKSSISHFYFFSLFEVNALILNFL